MRFQNVMQQLNTLANKGYLKQMERLGINTQNAKGIRIPELRKIAKNLGKDHLLAERLWLTGIHEARILATMIEDPSKVSRTKLNVWLGSIQSWDLCDHLCLNLMIHVPYSVDIAKIWSTRKGTFEKRAGFVTFAVLAQKNKRLPDHVFLDFLPFIKQESDDDRKLVQKAIIWALKQMGRRNKKLRSEVEKLLENFEKNSSKHMQIISRTVKKNLLS